jgi:hypothetical protein
VEGETLSAAKLFSAMAGGLAGGEVAMGIAIGVGVLTGPVGLVVVGAAGAIVGGYMGAQGVANLNAAAADVLQRFQ